MMPLFSACRGRGLFVGDWFQRLHGKKFQAWLIDLRVLAEHCYHHRGLDMVHLRS